jgi:hypothetical protein
MAAVPTGTPVEITWAAGADPAGQSITIPADATAVYMFWTFFHATDGQGLLTATLNGASPNQTLEVATGTPTDASATGVAVWYNPATGSKTLDVAWDIAPSEGSTTAVIFVKDGDTAAWRDADTDHDETSNAVTVTLTTVVGDLVIKMDQRYDATPDVFPSLSAGWTNKLTGSNVDENFRLSSISATGSTQVCNSEDEAYSTMVAVSIPAAAVVTALIAKSLLRPFAVIRASNY